MISRIYIARALIIDNIIIKMWFFINEDIKQLFKLNNKLSIQ